MVDVVDENGTMLYQTDKGTAHRDGLLHPTILAEVFDITGRWILVKQSSTRQDAGKYVSPVGGHIRAGEDEVIALKREAAEELGISDFSYTRRGQAVFNRDVLGRKENHLFILYEIVTGQRPVLNYESDSYRDFTEDALRQEMSNFPETFGDAWWFVVKKFYPRLLNSYVQ
jgi:8-oxo-dGTP pyrophosphatase MutT (NUDIX family)